MKPTKVAPTTCFCKQQNDNGANNNRLDVLMSDVETESENEASISQTTMKGKCNKMGKKSNQE